MTGFVLLKGECVECNNHFATCVSANNGTDCKHGFFEEVASKNCTACPSPSAHCSSATDFESCVVGHFPTHINSVKVKCDACATADNHFVACVNSTYATQC